MPLRFLFDDGSEMPLKEGLPAGYDGTVIMGARHSYIEHPSATIINQEYNNIYFSFNKLFIRWRSPLHVVLDHDFPPGIFTRTPIHNSLQEYIKGAGAIQLKNEQFYLLAGSSWKSCLVPAKPGVNTFMAISWSAEAIGDIIKDDPELKCILENSTAGLPIRFIDAPNALNATMKQLLFEITQLNLAGTKNVAVLADLLKKYCRAMLAERKHFDPYKRQMNSTDWELIHLVRKIIDDNLDTGFTTKDLAGIVDSYESKLKKLYPMITGSSMEVYRKYKLCVRAQINIMRHYQEPIKSFQPASGYSNMPNFSRACRVLCSCKPSQLRSKEWDVNELPHELINAV